MLDFASSLYLGIRHASHEMPDWEALSLGRPAALQELGAAVQAAAELAALVGCEAGTLLPSTFHLFWDLLGVLSTDSTAAPVEICMDAATYPIARWAAEFWAGKGVPLHLFARHDADSLARLRRRRPAGRPLVLCDAFSPGSLSQPPLADYAALVQEQGGWLVVDDTQGLGVFGHGPSATARYGSGGGGTLQRQGVCGEHVIVGASLAKGFGVPVALLAGSAAVLRRFERESQSRVHMSPPSMAVVQAARQALAVNRREGEARRLRLWRAVRRLRGWLARLGLSSTGGDFPVQTLVSTGPQDWPALHHALRQRGVDTVLHRDRGGGARLSFLLRADHGTLHIDSAMARLAQALRSTSSRSANHRRTPCMQ